MILIMLGRVGDAGQGEPGEGAGDSEGGSSREHMRALSFHKSAVCKVPFLSLSFLFASRRASQNTAHLVGLEFAEAVIAPARQLRGQPVCPPHAFLG